MTTKEENRTPIRISEILKLKERMSEINSIDLDNIMFMGNDGLPIRIDKSIIGEFKLTGLNNMDFICSGFYKEGFKK